VIYTAPVSDENQGTLSLQFSKKAQTVNNIIWRAIKQAQVPSTKEPLGLTTHRRSNGETLLLWSPEEN